MTNNLTDDDRTDIKITIKVGLMLFVILITLTAFPYLLHSGFESSQYDQMITIESKTIIGDLCYIRTTDGEVFRIGTVDYVSMKENTTYVARIDGGYNPRYIASMTPVGET